MVKLYNRFAEPQVITEQEWLDIKNHTAGHIDVETAVRLLMTNDHVKFQCTEGLQHKKRESARQKAERRGMKVNTMWADGWLYLKKMGVTSGTEPEPTH